MFLLIQNFFHLSVWYDVCNVWWPHCWDHWWGITMFLSGWEPTRGHSQPQTQQITAQKPPLWCISTSIWKIFTTKIPLYCEENPNYVLRKIQICWAGKSFCLVGRRMLNNRGWMIPVTTLSPKLSLPISTQQQQYTFHTLQCYANFSASHIDYTESENCESISLQYMYNFQSTSAV